MGWVNKDSNAKMYQQGGSVKKKYETGDEVSYEDTGGLMRGQRLINELGLEPEGTDISDAIENLPEEYKRIVDKQRRAKRNESGVYETAPGRLMTEAGAKSLKAADAAKKQTDGFKKRRESMWREPVAAMKKRKKAMDSGISAQMRARKAKKQKIEDMTLREVKDKMKSGAKEIKKRIGDTKVGDIKEAYKAINPAERVKSKLRDRMEKSMRERRAIERARRKQGR